MPLPPVRPQLIAEGRTFSRFDPIVSASVFHWFMRDDGNLSGAWPPVGGRENWTGEPDWWETQLKQMMAANLDVIYVHLIERFEQQRINLFKAYAKLRLEGFALPKIAPFLDPFGIWSPNHIDVAAEAGKDAFAQQYIRFYRQFFQENTYPRAAAGLMRIDDRLLLATWWVAYILQNLDRFTRTDLESRLAAAFPDQPEVFARGIWMATTALIEPDLQFSDERAVMFSGLHYCVQTVHNHIRTYHLQPGYWDQNIRRPGLFMPRAGGRLYRNMWDYVIAVGDVHRVYIESWNEYDESSGIYAALPDPPVTTSGHAAANTDVWSDKNDSFEYINTTREGAARINRLPELAASILDVRLPDTVPAGRPIPCEIIVRNEGNALWSRTAGYGLGVESSSGPASAFRDFEIPVDDDSGEAAAYGGVFRGRPLVFKGTLPACPVAGNYTIQWRMFVNRNGTRNWFGGKAGAPLIVTK